MLLVQSGSGAKEAFCELKKRIETFSKENATNNFLEPYIRYKIVNTNVYTQYQATIIADVLANIPVRIRPNTLSCLLLENNEYFFFIPSRLGTSNV
jgi:hypothetical protein